MSDTREVIFLGDGEFDGTDLLVAQQRFCIETFFSDQKSRGFHLADSHLRDPVRLERLLIASCLAYVWMVCLGVLVKATGQVARRSPQETL